MPRTKPPKNNASTGSAAQPSVFASEYLSSIRERSNGVKTQSRSVGTNGGVSSNSQSKRQVTAIEMTPASAHESTKRKVRATVKTTAPVIRTNLFVWSQLEIK